MVLLITYLSSQDRFFDKVFRFLDLGCLSWLFTTFVGWLATVGPCGTGVLGQDRSVLTDRDPTEDLGRPDRNLDGRSILAFTARRAVGQRRWCICKGSQKDGRWWEQFWIQIKLVAPCPYRNLRWLGQDDVLVGACSGDTAVGHALTCCKVICIHRLCPAHVRHHICVAVLLLFATRWEFHLRRCCIVCVRMDLKERRRTTTFPCRYTWGRLAVLTSSCRSLVLVGDLLYVVSTPTSTVMVSRRPAFRGQRRTLPHRRLQDVTKWCSRFCNDCSWLVETSCTESLGSITFFLDRRKGEKGRWLVWLVWLIGWLLVFLVTA